MMALQRVRRRRSEGVTRVGEGATRVARWGQPGIRGGSSGLHGCSGVEAGRRDKFMTLTLAEVGRDGALLQPEVPGISSGLTEEGGLVWAQTQSNMRALQAGRGVRQRMEDWGGGWGMVARQMPCGACGAVP